ncbi:MAG: AI-2E family transporter [Hyphomicrobiales bacterium]
MPSQVVPQQQPLRLPSAAPSSATATATILAITVAALYLGRELLIPLALSILVSFALSPAATLLRRWGLGRIPSALLVVIVVFALVAGFATVVTSQVTGPADNLARYEYNLRAKIRAVETFAQGGGPLKRMQKVWEDIQKELEKSTQGSSGTSASTSGSSAGTGEQAPIPVEVHEPPAKPVQIASEFAGGLFKPLATTGIIIVFVIFFLLQREDMRDRFLRLFGSNDVHRTTEAMTDAGKRVSRYLLMQLMINAFYGTSVSVGLWLIGVPHPFLWGLLAFVLRFIPYVGPAIAAGMPIIIAVAGEPGWTKPLLAVALFAGLELLINNVLEPWLYGSSTGLSPIAILVAAVFWTTIWGAPGLLLSTPLTVCLVVLGRHVPKLQFLEILLGSEPVLPPEVKLYQRLLADDFEGAARVSDQYLQEHTVQELYDRVLIPALAFADQDRMRGALDREGWTAVAKSIGDIVDDVRAETPSSDAESRHGAVRVEVRRAHPGPIVLCVGARNDLDEAAAAMLAHLLAIAEFDARVLAGSALGTSDFESLRRDRPVVFCLSYVNPEALHHARRMIRRIRQSSSSNAPIVLGLWNGYAPGGDMRGARERTEADRLAASLAAALREVEEVVQSEPEVATPSTAA